MADLFPTGDRELWIAEGRDGSWAFPLYVEWRQDRETYNQYALIMPAVCPYHSQLLLLQAMFGTQDIMGSNDQWLLPASIVGKLLHKAPGITPTYYYKWPDGNMPALPTVTTMKVAMPDTPEIRNTRGSSDHESFVSYISQKNGLSTSLVKVVLKAICADAPKWMLEKRRPLDLGFCKLIAAPFRPNWKEIVACKFKHWKLREVFNLGKDTRNAKLEEIGMPSALCSVHNIALRKGQFGAVEYVIEAVPSKQFDEAVYKMEKKRQACGATSYVASFEKTVESLYKHLLSALEIHLRKTSLPFARVSESGGTGLQRFLPASGSAVKVRGVGVNQLPVHIIAPSSGFSVHGESGNKSLVHPKATPVQDMSIVPRGTNDMRECQEQRAMDQPQQSGANGMLMLDGDKGSNSGESMLSGAEVNQS